MKLVKVCKFSKSNSYYRREIIFFAAKFVFEANPNILPCTTKQMKRSHYNDKDEVQRLVECENRFYMRSSFSSHVKTTAAQDTSMSTVGSSIFLSSVSPILFLLLLLFEVIHAASLSLIFLHDFTSYTLFQIIG